MSETDAHKKVMDGSLWDEFCDNLKEAGKVVQSTAAPDSAFDKAEGYRYLTRLLRGGLESSLEFGDPAFPVLNCPCHETIKMGADNPDNYYQSTAIDPKYDYRIVGTRGSVDYLGFSTVDNRYANGGTMETTGFLDSRQLSLGTDGEIEIVLSSREQPGNWLPMTGKTNSLNVRQTFKDRKGEQQAELRIERLNAANDRPQPLTPDRLAAGLRRAVNFVAGTSELFEQWSESFLPDKNLLPPADQDYCQSIGGDPNIYYFHSYWALEDDEVLLLRADSIPECQTWNFQLDNWWMESLDYRYHRIHFNQHSASLADDGSVTLVVAHRDPSHPNWVETAGHDRGTMCWRWIGARDKPPVLAKVVKQADLERELASWPDNT